TDYEAATRIRLPDGYSFRDGENQILEPTLMQKYVAYKVKINHRFGNFSGTGAGKTLSAILASRVIECHLAVIICPNAVVDQWAKDIKRTFPDSIIQKRKEAFNEKYDENKHKYLIINYDLLSQPYSPNLVLKLVKQRIDFVVLDEIHFTKKREKTNESKRRHIIEGMMTEVVNKNTDAYVLGLSATPVINELEEGKSILELITHKKYDDISTRPLTHNAVTLYKKLSLISIREILQYPVIPPKDVIVEVDIRKCDINIKKLKNNPLEVELLTIDAKIPEIIKHIQGPTIIYTQYVTGIISKLRSAVQAAGYSCAEYTGDDHTGLDIFKNKKVEVLIASNPISVGVDGLQHICNNLIINTLPWTNAGYQQLVGRLIRKGGKTDFVNIFVIKAKFVDQISDKEFEYDEKKWERILNKRTLADCAVDGILPWKNMVTPNRAMMEAVKWLERMVKGEISSVFRRDLYVELTPVEIKERIIKYGDFTRLNNQINNENSKTTHERMLRDPRIFDEYHRQYRDARKGWGIIPYDEIIKGIKQLFTSRMLATLQIGDFGCGEAKIMDAFGSERVYSFDHIAANSNVTACDMKNTGLPDDVLDVAVFSLSLMGRNWPDYIKEAKRCLEMNGYLLIAETTNSLRTRLVNLREILKQKGFEIYSDEERGDFTFIEAREV
ncbi:MAG: DEAD/DEAH box helicase family protein, partial [Nitrososphaeraceae archaeon]